MGLIPLTPSPIMFNLTLSPAQLPPPCSRLRFHSHDLIFSWSPATMRIVARCRSRRYLQGRRRTCIGRLAEHPCDVFISNERNACAWQDAHGIRCKAAIKCKETFISERASNARPGGRVDMQCCMVLHTRAHHLVWIRQCNGQELCSTR